MARANGPQDSNNDFFYRPDIQPPERDYTTDGTPLDEGSAYLRTNAKKAAADEDAYGERVLYDGKYRAEEIPDPYKAWIPIFTEHMKNAAELKERARALLDLSIADIPGYIGDAPPYIREYVSELTGIAFPSEEEDPESSSEVFTLPFSVRRCIFRTAGYYDSVNDKSLADDAAKFDEKALEQQMKNTLSGKKYLGKHGILMYGIKLLVIVLKLSYVIMVYYTIGYLCGFFKGKLKFGYSKKIAGKKIGFEFKIGDKISDYLKGIERTLLSIVGYRCSDKPNVAPVECPQRATGSDDLEKQFSFRDIQCCTTKPIFFDNRQFYTQNFDFSKCLKAAVDMEMDPRGYIHGPICSYENADVSREQTAEEQAKAKVVAEYLVSKGESRYGINGYQNIGPLNNAINAADSAEIMSQHVNSMLNESSFRYTNYAGGKNPFDCFGYSSDDDMEPIGDVLSAINSSAGRWLKEGGDPPIVITQAGTPPFEFIGDFIKALDKGVGSLIDIADRVVVGTANLALWGSSRQLCCWVYLLVFASTMMRRLIQTNGHLCNDKRVKCYNCGGSGKVEGGGVCPVCVGVGEIQDAQAFAHDLRHEMGAMWATEIKSSAEVQQFVAVLRVINAIVDAYIGSLKRPVLLQGLRLPLQEMWELVKLTIANGISQFVDTLLYPIDVILSGLQGIPEVRLAIANECFGIDRLFDFLICNINNLKFSLVNAVMRLIDFSISDVTLINDIYLTRTRLATLEALSRLLKSLINLILGLKDCYNPAELVDEIVNKQVAEQYQQIRDIEDLLAEAGMTLDTLWSMRESLVGNKFPVSDEERSALDSAPATLSSHFAPLGNVAEDIVVRSLESFDTMVNNVLGEGVAPMSMQEFAQILATASGTSIAEVKESLLDIFDILRGSGND